MDAFLAAVSRSSASVRGSSGSWEGRQTSQGRESASERRGRTTHHDELVLGRHGRVDVGRADGAHRGRDGLLADGRAQRGLREAEVVLVELPPERCGKARHPHGLAVHARVNEVLVVLVDARNLRVAVAAQRPVVDVGRPDENALVVDDDDLAVDVELLGDERVALARLVVAAPPFVAHLARARLTQVRHRVGNLVADRVGALKAADGLPRLLVRRRERHVDGRVGLGLLALPVLAVEHLRLAAFLRDGKLDDLVLLEL